MHTKFCWKYLVLPNGCNYNSMITIRLRLLPEWETKRRACRLASGFLSASAPKFRCRQRANRARAWACPGPLSVRTCLASACDSARSCLLASTACCPVRSVLSLPLAALNQSRSSCAVAVPWRRRRKAACVISSRLCPSTASSFLRVRQPACFELVQRCAAEHALPRSALPATMCPFP